MVGVVKILGRGNVNSRRRGGMGKRILRGTTLRQRMELFRAFFIYFTGTSVKVCKAYGEYSMGHNLHEIRMGCDILIVTLGRFEHLIMDGYVNLHLFCIIIIIAFPDWFVKIELPRSGRGGPSVDKWFSGWCSKYCCDETISTSMIYLCFNNNSKEIFRRQAAKICSSRPHSRSQCRKSPAKFWRKRGWWLQTANQLRPIHELDKTSSKLNQARKVTSLRSWLAKNENLPRSRIVS